MKLGNTYITSHNVLMPIIKECFWSAHLLSHGLLFHRHDQFLHESACVTAKRNWLINYGDYNAIYSSFTAKDFTIQYSHILQ